MTGAATGAFSFVLHTHLPYARLSGRWPHGEEWIHEAATDTYLPLLATLHDLAAEGVRFRLTIGITPVLAEQLADGDVIANLDAYLEDLRGRAASDVGRFERDGEAPLGALAAFYRDRFDRLLDMFRARFGRDLVGAFRDLLDRGFIEIAGSAATHGYLPLLTRDSSVYAQVRTGLRSHARHFGRTPAAFWLPECAYRPAVTQDGVHRPGIEEFLEAQGVRLFFVESSTIARAGGSTFEPYRVGGSRVAVLGRNETTGKQVWSAGHGYPGDFAYREFHKKEGESGLRYWRVTGDAVDLGAKHLYDPAAAAARTEEHARHFAALAREELSAYRAQSGRAGIIVAAYDTELFGHWWFEGSSWLGQTLRLLAADESIELTCAAQHVGANPPEAALPLPESSWGSGGTHATWQNGDTAWMWDVIDGAQRRMETISAGYREGAPDADARRQAARELLLLESSDWPFLASTGQARDYAEMRFREHAARFEGLAAQIEGGTIAADAVGRLWEQDKLFPDIDPGDFRKRQGASPAIPFDELERGAREG